MGAMPPVGPVTCLPQQPMSMENRVLMTAPQPTVTMVEHQQPAPPVVVQQNTMISSGQSELERAMQATLATLGVAAQGLVIG